MRPLDAVRARVLSELASEVVLEVLDSGEIAWASASARDVLGWDPDRLVGRSVHELVEAGRLESTESAGGELEVLCADGSRRWMAVRAAAVPSDARGASSRLVALRDVHDQIVAQRSLVHSEQRYRLLAEHATDVVALCDSGRRIVWVSPTVEGALGWSAAALEGTDPCELVHPDDRACCALPGGDLAARDKVPRHCVVRVRARAGEYRWMSLRVTAAPEDSAGVVIWGLRDVDDLVEARESRVRSEARLRATMDSLLDPHVLLQAVRNPSGRVVDFVCLDANEAAASFVGRSVEGVLGLRLTERYPEAVEAGWVTMFTGVLERSAPLVVDDLAYEPEGPEAHRRYDIRAAIVGDGVSFTWRDVTARHDVAVALATSEARYRDLVENTGDVLFRASLDALIEWVSPSSLDMTGWRSEELVGLRVPDLVVFDDRPVVAATVARVVLGERAKCEAQLLLRDGERRWASIVFGPIRTGDEVTGLIGRIRDVQSETAALEALRRSEGQLRLALRSAPVGMAVIDLDRRFVQANPALCHMLGRDEEWLLAHRLPDVLDRGDDALDLRMRAQILSERDDVVSWEHRLGRGDGSRIWVNHSLGLLRDDSNCPVSYISTFFNITEERAFRERLRFESTHDVLTQVSNRRDFFSRAARLMARRPRTGDRIAVLFIDVDRLKETNDCHGHSVGDRLLAEIAHRISGQLRAGDLVARLGGDEFAAVLAELHGVDDAELVAEKILRALDEPVEADGLHLDANVSIGIALVESGDDAETAVRHADAALYVAKRAGRARYSTYVAGGA